ncbi:hypothetical protein CYMTET_21737 [Cymbomonas tetramitiformis]|uniref:S-adenosyl-L-methionine-dependent methyltransferase n=1 Tax=Cymbomonas tetramitiformis TaxID=36881 RepID=A0AAE0L2Z8_9CHLO|nr:hypothetical protein CYMTET_21737 [Cymbomonas tetramitiformis]
MPHAASPLDAEAVLSETPPAQPPATVAQKPAAEQQQPSAAAQQPAAQPPAIVERQQSSPRIRPGGPLVDKQDWKLISSEFARLQSKYSRALGGPFQVDACCDAMGQNRQANRQPLLREFGLEIVEVIPRVNEHGTAMLRCYVAENQEDWDLWVTPVEYAINDSTSAATGFSPFELVYGHAPATQLDFFMDAALEGGSRRRKGGRVAADKRGTAHELAKQFARQLQAARVNLQMAQQRMMEQFDARHRLQHIKVNDQVWVDGQHLTLPGDQGLKPKLRKLRHGPLRVVECLYSDRQQELPEQDRGAPSAYRLEPLRVFEAEEERLKKAPEKRRRETHKGQEEQRAQLMAMRPPTPTVHSSSQSRAYQPHLSRVQHPVRILVLFCGTGSVEQQFQRQFRDCEVVTVDILPKWQATCTEDILHWNYKLYPRHHFDVIWASPPCKEYSKAKTLGAPDLKLADRRVRRTREIIEFYDPAYFFIVENPAGDALRGLHTRAVMKGLPEPLLATYSQAVYAIPRALLHHLFCELKLNERMKEESALAVMNLISTLTARTDTFEFQDTEAGQPRGAMAAEDP